MPMNSVVPSSAVEPTTTSTWLPMPCSVKRRIWSGNRWPSTKIERQGAPTCASASVAIIVSASSLRSPTMASGPSPSAPSASATARPMAWPEPASCPGIAESGTTPSSLVSEACLAKQPPDCPIAFWNNPLASGVAVR